MDYYLDIFEILNISSGSLYTDVSTLNHRRLASADTTKTMAWKSALWDRQSIEPAMLRVPIVIITFLFLWAFNLWILERVRMQYLSALAVKSAPILFILVAGLGLFMAYAINMTFLSNLFHWSLETGVFIFYISFAIFLMLPITFGNESKQQFLKLCKLCVFPSSTIHFTEVLFADALTSLSKVFKDFSVTIIAIYCHFYGIEIVEYHNIGMIIIAIFASFPFVVRIKQCSVQYFGSSDPTIKFQVFLNIMKYFSAFPPIWIAAIASLGYFHPNLPTITAVMATINSLYGFLWDIIMDWGLVSINRHSQGGGFIFNFRSRIMWPISSYFAVVLINLILRFSWAANRIPLFSQMHASNLVLMVEIAEIFRRAMWNLYRIEWEVIVQQDRELARNKIELNSTSRDV